MSAARLKEISDLLDVPMASWFENSRKRIQKQSTLSEMLEFISSVRSIRLLKAFSQIKDPKAQKLLADLCEKFAEKQ